MKLTVLLGAVGYVVQDVVADAMTVEAVPHVDAGGQLEGLVGVFGPKSMPLELRRKIGKDYIATRRGFGYVFKGSDET